MVTIVLLLTLPQPPTDKKMHLKKSLLRSIIGARIQSIISNIPLKQFVILNSCNFISKYRAAFATSSMRQLSISSCSTHSFWHIQGLLGLVLHTTSSLLYCYKSSITKQRNTPGNTSLCCQALVSVQKKINQLICYIFLVFLISKSKTVLDVWPGSHDCLVNVKVFDICV